MEFVFVPLVLLHLLLIIIYTVVLIYTWDIKEAPGARYFLAAVILAVIWVLLQSLEIMAVKLEAKLFLSNLQYLPILLLATMFLLYVREFTHRYDKKMKATGNVVLVVIPIVICILVWVFPQYLSSNMRLVNVGNFQMVAKDYGILFWAMAAYNYCLTFISSLILVKSMRQKAEILRKQIGLTLLAVIFPVFANVLRISKLSPLPIDMTPFFFIFTVLLISYGIVRYKLFTLVPIARAMVIKVMKSGMVVFDVKGNLLDINPAAKQMLAFKEMPVGGEKIEDIFVSAPELIRIFDSKTEQVCEFVYEKNGSDNYYEASLTCIKNSSGKEYGWLFQINNITERKLAEDIIKQAAYHDPLTGLPNRQYFQLLLTQELTLAKMRGKKIAVAFVDIDNFKTINDNHGHQVGDTVLKAITKRLGEALHEADIISRLGGDEFAVVIPNIGSVREVKVMGERLLAAFKADFNMVEFKMPVQVSIGFALYPDDGDNYETLLRKADKAMYSVKNTGKNNYAIYKKSSEKESM
jgi:diguanylate cyclase (GGDEF)-like protein/PAS domain S-box-containing protein